MRELHPGAYLKKRGPDFHRSGCVNLVVRTLNEGEKKNILGAAQEEGFEEGGNKKPLR